MSVGNVDLARLRATLEAETGDFERKLARAKQVLREIETQQATTGQAAIRHGQQLGELERAFGRLHLGAQAAHAVMIAWAAATGTATAAVALSVKAAVDFQSSFAGVRKTVDGTREDLDALSQDFRNLARAVPLSVNEVNRIGESAGALGVAREDIVEFTRVMAMLGTTTNLSAEQAATAMARLSNVMGEPLRNVGALAAVLVDLGNKGAATESEIVTMALRIAGAGKQVGLSTEEVLGYANALSSLGLEAEAGGTAISRVFADIAQATSSMSREAQQKLSDLAQVLGTTPEDVRQRFRANAAQLVEDFFRAIRDRAAAGQNVFSLTEMLNFDDVRVRDAITRTASGVDVLAESLRNARTAREEGAAAEIEFAKRLETTASQIQLAVNAGRDIAITFGTPLAEALGTAAKAFADAAKESDAAYRSIAQDLTPAVKELSGQLVPLAAAMGTNLPTALERTIAVLAVMDRYLRSFGELFNRIGTGFSRFFPQTTQLLGSAGGITDQLFGDFERDIDEEIRRRRVERELREPETPRQTLPWLNAPALPNVVAGMVDAPGGPGSEAGLRVMREYIDSLKLAEDQAARLEGVLRSMAGLDQVFDTDPVEAAVQSMIDAAGVINLTGQEAHDLLATLDQFPEDPAGLTEENIETLRLRIEATGGSAEGLIDLLREQPTGPVSPAALANLALFITRAGLATAEADAFFRAVERATGLSLPVFGPAVPPGLFEPPAPIQDTRLQQALDRASGLSALGGAGAGLFQSIENLNAERSARNFESVAQAVERVKASFRDVPQTGAWTAELGRLVAAAEDGTEESAAALRRFLENVNTQVPLIQQAQRELATAQRQAEAEAKRAAEAAARETARLAERHAELIAQFVRISEEGAGAVEETLGRFGARYHEALSSAFEAEAGGSQGQQVAKAMTDLIRAAVAAGVPGAEEAGRELKAATLRALSTKSDADRQAALSLVQNLQDEIKAQSALTPANFVRSLLQATQRADLGEGASVTDAIKRSVEEGTPEALAAVGTTVEALRRRLLGNEGLTVEQAEAHWAAIMSQVTQSIEEGGEDARQALEAAFAQLNVQTLLDVAGNRMADTVNAALDRARDQMLEAARQADERIQQAITQLEESRAIRGATENVSETQARALEGARRANEQALQDLRDYVEDRERLHNRELEDDERVHRRRLEDARLAQEARRAGQTSGRGVPEELAQRVRAQGFNVGPVQDPAYEAFRRKQALKEARDEEDRELARRRGIEDRELERRRTLRETDREDIEKVQQVLTDFQKRQAVDLRNFQDRLDDERLQRAIGPGGTIEKEKNARITAAQEALNEIERLENEKFRAWLTRMAAVHPTFAAILAALAEAEAETTTGAASGGKPTPGGKDAGAGKPTDPGAKPTAFDGAAPKRVTEPAGVATEAVGTREIVNAIGVSNLLLGKIAGLFEKAKTPLTDDRLRGIIAGQVPRMAAGGIVSSPTLALIGEAGPEAVVPLSGGRGAGIDYDRLINGIAGAILSRPVETTVNLDSRVLAESIAPHQVRSLTTQYAIGGSGRR